MKHCSLIIAIIVTFTFMAAPAALNAQEEKRLSIWERIFGTSEKPSKETAQEKAENETKKVTAEKSSKTEKSKKHATFSDEEREVLEGWQNGNAKWKKSKKSLPPGLQKKVARGGELPPGWKKKLEIGSVLDPELEKQAVSLPEEILKHLPKTPEGTEIVKIGDEIVRVLENSREIIDILSGRGTRD